MSLEVREPGDALGARVVAAERDGVGVVEPQRHADGKPHRSELGVELGQRRNRLELEDLLGDRAGVLGVYVDAAGGERIQHDRRVAEPLAVRRRCLARGLCALLDDLAQDVRLGEALRADGERRRRNRGGACRKRDGPHQNADRNPRPHERPPHRESFARFRA